MAVTTIFKANKTLDLCARRPIDPQQHFRAAAEITFAARASTLLSCFSSTRVEMYDLVDARPYQAGLLSGSAKTIAKLIGVLGFLHAACMVSYELLVKEENEKGKTKAANGGEDNIHLGKNSYHGKKSRRLVNEFNYYVGIMDDAERGRPLPFSDEHYARQFNDYAEEARLVIEAKDFKIEPYLK